MEDLFEKLTAEFKRRQKRNAKYSIRAFARDLDMDHSLLARVLAGKRPISRVLAVKLREKLNEGDDTES